ncbi:MAG: IBR domain-containing protein [archaeon]|nr:IBR domain-containing protein [archaeon]
MGNDLRRAVGEPNTEVEDFSSQLPAGASDARGVPHALDAGKGAARLHSLRFSTDMAAVEGMMDRLALRMSVGTSSRRLLKASGGSAPVAPLESVAEMVGELLKTAVEEGREERVERLLRYQGIVQDALKSEHLRASWGRPLAASGGTGGPQVDDRGRVDDEEDEPPPGHPESDQMCPICYLELSASELIPLSGCGRHFYCAECLGGHLTALINDAKVSNILCPAPMCLAACTEPDVRSLVAPEVYDRYLQFLLLDMLNQMDPVWCPNCHGPILPSEGTCPAPSSLIICPSCQEYICSTCKQPYHPDTTCTGEQVIDPAVKNWLVQQGTACKECPNCFFLVQKTSGCNHMSCRV